MSEIHEDVHWNFLHVGQVSSDEEHV